MLALPLGLLCQIRGGPGQASVPRRFCWPGLLRLPCLFWRHGGLFKAGRFCIPRRLPFQGRIAKLLLGHSLYPLLLVPMVNEAFFVGIPHIFTYLFRSTSFPFPMDILRYFLYKCPLNCPHIDCPSSLCGLERSMGFTSKQEFKK